MIVSPEEQLTGDYVYQAHGSTSLGAVLAYYIERPVEFVFDILRARPDKWQQRTLELMFLERKRKMAVASCTGAGKDALASWIILYYLLTRAFPKVPCTANTKDQLFSILWAETYKWIRQSRQDKHGNPLIEQILDWSPTTIRHRAHPQEWFAVARTATPRIGEGGEKQAEALGGFHGDFLLFVVDEASGVDRANIEAAEGTLTGYENLLLMIGNPLRTNGAFFDVFHTPGIDDFWGRLQVSALPASDSQYVAGDTDYPTSYSEIRMEGIQRNAKELIAKHGERSTIVQARVYGRFPTNNAVDVAYTWNEVLEAMERKIEPAPTDEVQIGVDCARFGDDQTIFQPRRGKKMYGDNEGREKWPKNDVVDIAAKIMLMSDDPKWKDLTRPHFNFRPLVVVDDDGVGGGVVDICQRNGYKNVIGFHANGRAWDWIKYANASAEAWLKNLKEFVQTGQLPNDNDMLNQLTNRKYIPTLKGPQMAIEPKDQMKRRGLRSPDESDGACLSVIIPVMPGIA